MRWYRNAPELTRLLESPGDDLAPLTPFEIRSLMFEHADALLEATREAEADEIIYVMKIPGDDRVSVASGPLAETPLRDWGIPFRRVALHLIAHPTVGERIAVVFVHRGQIGVFEMLRRPSPLPGLA